MQVDLVVYITMRRVTSWGLKIGLVVGLCAVWLVFAVNPVVFNYANALIDAVAVQAVNKAVADVVNTETYSSLTDIRRDPSGTITSINADAVAMNLLAVKVSAYAQNYLASLGEAGIAVPIGTFSGLPFLVGQGWSVKLNFKLVGAVNCSFDSEFRTAGCTAVKNRGYFCSFRKKKSAASLYSHKSFMTSKGKKIYSVVFHIDTDMSSCLRSVA